MDLLEVKNIRFGYQDDQLYYDASLRLFNNEHAVLVGPNGSGKSTLLKLLNRDLKPDKGSIDWLPTKSIGYLDQYAKIKGSMKVKTYLYDVFSTLFEKEKTMETCYEQCAITTGKEQEKLMHRAARLQEELLDSDFYAIKSKIGDIMSGLGLPIELLDEPIKHLSGGMRAKIILGKLLMEEADVLLLDEPTNFLDIKHIAWLVKFLNQYPKAFIVVSHDETFLRAIAQTVFAIENKIINRYKGDFEFYLAMRELEKVQHEKAYKSQQKFIKKTEEFIQKNITRAKTTKRAQSRRKMLKKLPKIDKPQQARTYKFWFPMSSTTGQKVLKTNDLEIGYNDSLIEPLNMVIRKEEKVVITGKNGIGKSTFIKTILNQIPAINGTYEWIDTAHIAYFEQDSTLDKTLTPLEIVHYHYPDFTKHDIMSLLGNHGITYDMANRLIESLSGGEKTKVRLALLRHQKGNVLIMDEPTNHLDAAAKDALKDALIAYPGTLILVSHEQSFYEGICDYEIAFSGE
jgi:ATPase subunit of ABC transporter with duplicated ATPase domains